MEPIRANCTRYSGRASALAPASSSRQQAVAVGITAPIAGRSTPGIRCNPKRPAAITAPLLPALTKPAARPSSTIVQARTIDEFFLVRTACAGCSSMAITSGASSISAHLPAPAFARAVSTFSFCPTKITSTPSSRCACTPPATTWSGAKSPPMASSAIFIGTETRDASGLDVQVAHGLRVRLDEAFAGVHVVAHQDVENLVGLHRVLDLDPQQHAVLGVHGGIPELLGVHLAETLVAGDLWFSLHLRQLSVLLLLSVCIADLLAARDLVQRRLGNIEVSVRDHLGHVPEEEGEQERADVRTIDVSVRHENYVVIAQLANVELLTDTGAEGGDEVADLLRREDLVLAGLFDIEDLAAQGQNGLEAAVARALCRATRGIALDQVDLAEAGIAFGAIGQLAGQRRGLEQRLALHQLPSALGGVACPRRHQAFLDDPSRVRRILLEILGVGVGEDGLHLAADLGVAELGLRLTFELRLAHLDADHRRQPLANVVAGEVRVLLAHQVRLAGVLVEDRGQRRAKAGDVAAAFDGIDVVREGEDVFGEALVVLQGDLHRIAVDLSLDVQRPEVDPAFVAVQI